MMSLYDVKLYAANAEKTTEYCESRMSMHTKNTTLFYILHCANNFIIIY